MDNFKCIQRVYCIEEEKIEEGIKNFPKGFADGLAVITANRVYVDRTDIPDFNQYVSFFERLRKQGIPLQVDISTTFGHGDIQLPADIPTMVSIDGIGCKSSVCPRTKKFEIDLTERVKKYAALHPQVLWIDDDFRMSHHYPVDFGCFCDHCISLFNDKYGFNLTREQIKESIFKNLNVNEKSIRLCWRAFTRSALLNTARIVKNAAHSVDDNIILGFMQINPDALCYELLDYRDLIEIAKNKNNEIWFRPGSGFYDDLSPHGVIVKNLELGRFCSMTKSAKNAKVVNLTEEVTSPYIRRGKSMKITFLEAVMNIGVAGADGTMDEGIKPNLPEQLMEGNLVSMMHDKYDYLSTVYRLIQNKKQIGIYPYFSNESWQYNDEVKKLDDLGFLGANYWHNMVQLGIPFTFYPENSNVLLLSGTSVRAMENSTLENWLRKSIYMDGTTALEINKKLGYNATGIKKADYDADILGAGTSEIFLSHPLNADMNGYERYNIWGGDRNGAADIQTDGAEAISYSINPNENEAKIVGTAIMENANGGRLSICARGPWCFDTLGYYKGEQIKNIVDWLYRGKAPCRIKSPLRIGQSIWENEKERIIFVYNLDFDDGENIELILDKNYSYALLTDDCTWVDLGKGSNLKLPLIKSWSSAIIKAIPIN